MLFLSVAPRPQPKHGPQASEKWRNTRYGRVLVRCRKRAICHFPVRPLQLRRTDTCPADTCPHMLRSVMPRNTCVLACSLGYTIQSYSIQSHPIPSNPIQSHPIQSHRTPSNPIQPHRTPSHPIPSHPIQRNPIQSNQPNQIQSDPPLPSFLPACLAAVWGPFPNSRLM